MGPIEGLLEVETTFDLERGVATPDLSGFGKIKGVSEARPVGTQKLTAAYYDTADFDLLRHGVTLRRRTGGSDTGWHLKLPAGRGRLEIRRPAGRSGSPVPADLSALVRSLVRDRPLRPVVRLRTTRVVTRLLDAGGRALAELATDEVTATVLGEDSSTTFWREVEIELVEAGPKLLGVVGRRLRRLGAIPSTHPSTLARALDGHLPAQPVPNGHRGPRHGTGAGDVIRGRLRTQRDQLLACDPRVRLDADDAVHGMRVIARRLRSALVTFGPLFAHGSTTALRGELAWLAGVLGAARDAEVLRDLLAAELAALPEPLLHGPVTERIGTDLDEAYRTAHAQVVVELDGERYLALLTALDTFVADPPYSRSALRRADQEIPRLIRRAVRRVTRELDAARSEADLEQRELRSHEVRKAAKRARYAAEAADTLFGSRARKLAKRMRKVQETLGSHQDSLLAREWLLEASARAQAAGEPTFSYGLLYARQAHGDGDTDANLASAAALLAPSALDRPPEGSRR
jgi:CHAD domain-containing protein